MMKQTRCLLALTVVIYGASGRCSLAQSADAFEPAPVERVSIVEAAGLHSGDWLLRARIAGLFSVRETSSIELIGGEIEMPDMLLPDLQIVYFLTDHISIEGQAGVVRTHPRVVGSLVGDFNIGTVWSAAAAASLQYHLLPDARLNPYVGVGVSYSRPISTEPARGISDFDVGSQTSMMIQAGADYQISGNWFGNGVAKYVFVPEQVYEGGGLKSTFDADMVFVGAGIGYRF